jgi:hypothetical protein
MLERRSRKTRRATKQSDVRVGIALAISAFAISIFLYLQPQYFGALTKAVAIALTCLGFAGLGIELNKITSEELDSLINREKGPGIFNNLGFGIASLIVWGALYHYFRITWVNVVTSVVLLIGVYSTTLGLVNCLFFVLTRPSSKADLSQSESDRRWSLAIKIVAAISGVTGLIASLIQILQFLKIVP